MKTNLQKIPGVGPNTEKDFKEIGIDSIESLRGKILEGYIKISWIGGNGKIKYLDWECFLR